MVWCLTAPNHYHTWINIDLSSVRSSDIHLRAFYKRSVSWKKSINSVRETNTCLLMNASKFWAGPVENWPGWVKFCIKHKRDICFGQMLQKFSFSHWNWKFHKLHHFHEGSLYADGMFTVLGGGGGGGGGAAAFVGRLQHHNMWLLTGIVRSNP